MTEVSMKTMLILAVAAILCQVALQYNNGVGATPQMGWNTWNKFACEVSEALIKDSARALIAKGLDKVGYTYINIDDCW
jgi:alpha-galactosidase